MIAHLSKRKLSKFAKQEILDLLPEAHCLKRWDVNGTSKTKKENKLP